MNNRQAFNKVVRLVAEFTEIIEQVAGLQQEGYKEFNERVIAPLMESPEAFTPAWYGEYESYIDWNAEWEELEGLTNRTIRARAEKYMA